METKKLVYTIGDKMSAVKELSVNYHVAMEKLSGREVKQVEITMYGPIIGQVKTIK